MERSLSAVAVQGSALRKGCVGTEQTSDRHVTDKLEKRGSQSFGSREMQMEATMVVSFTPVRMEPLGCTHFCCLESREGTATWKNCSAAFAKAPCGKPQMTW